LFIRLTDAVFIFPNRFDTLHGTLQVTFPLSL